MSYIQLVAPNLLTVGDVGYCLAFAENVFGTPHIYPTATDAWLATQYKHLDRNFPAVSFPVWFSYFEGGVDYGHVATYVPGKGILSSPYKSNGTQVWFKDVDDCARVLGCTYLGWSEDIANVQVIKGENIVPQEDYDALKADRDRFNEDWSRQYYIIGGADPTTITQTDRRARLGLTFEEASADLARDFPIPPNTSPFELQQKIDNLNSANLKLTDQLQTQKSPATAQPDADLTNQVKENNSLLSQLLAKLGSIFK